MRTILKRSRIGWLMTSAALCLPSVGSFAEQSEGQKAIERYIEAHSQEGVFSIFDSRASRALALRLTSIHSTAHPMKSGEVFYCADFTGLDGKLYDLDFYVDENKANPVVVESFIHKAQGKDRIRPPEDAKGVGETRAAAVRKAIGEGWTKPIQFFDSRRGKKLTLTYDHVHDTVKALGDGSFFACVDARDAAGVLYDLDVYVAPDGRGYKIKETLIHKRDGVERLR